MTKSDHDDGFVAKHELLGAVIDSDWATRLDIRVARHVIELYRRDHKNARASLRYLAIKTRTDRSNVIGSVRHLCEQGVFSVLREGQGTRPTEYQLNFNYPVQSASGGTATTPTSGGTATTSCGGTGTTSTGASGGTATTESHLQSPVTRTGDLINGTPDGECTHAPASGECSSAAGAASPTPPRGTRDPSDKDPFDELWQAWGNKRDRHKARAAYSKLKPTAELHDHLVAQAAAWTENYARIGREKKYQTSLANWLALEKYDEDLPEPYQDAKDAAVAKNRANGGKKQEKVAKTALPGKHGHNFPLGETAVEVLSAELIGAGTDAVSVTMKVRACSDKHAGAEFEHGFFIDHTDEDVKATGTRLLKELASAIGVDGLQDTNELVGNLLVAGVHPNGELHYATA